MLVESAKLKDGAHVYAYQVTDPEKYGVVAFDENGTAISLEEKPKAPKSRWAVTGIYFYDAQVVKIAKNLKPSARGELEITDLNRHYLNQKNLKVQLLGRGVAWLDTGSADSLLSASLFVQTLEKRQGLQFACLEEIAFAQGFIDHKQLALRAEKFQASSYGAYLRKLLEMNSNRTCGLRLHGPSGCISASPSW